MRRHLLALPVALLAVTSRGDGLRRPQNAPGVQQTPIGVQPGSPGITIAHIIIVTGPGGGVFIYAAGTQPGPGNPPVAWISNGTTDPYGNALPEGAQMGLAGSGTFAAGTTLITPSGTYTYDPSIAAENLLSSDTAVDGTSPTGDTTYAGLAAYGSAGALVRLLQGRIVFDTGDTAYMTLSGTNLTIRAVTESLLLDLPVQDIFALKPGTSATEDDWQSPAPALLNSWANNASFGSFNYRKVSSPADSVEITGAISAAAATSATFFTLPSGYVPAHAGGRPCHTNTGNAGASAVAGIRWDASGNLSVASNAALPNGATYLFGFTIPLGA